MLGSLFFLFALLILGYVWKYRVHVHLNIEITSSRKGEARSGEARKNSRPRKTAMACGTQIGNRPVTGSQNGPGGRLSESRPVPIDSVVWGDISSALENLGAPKHRARAAAEHVVRNWPDASFDVQFREALKELQAA